MSTRKSGKIVRGTPDPNAETASTTQFHVPQHDKGDPPADGTTASTQLHGLPFHEKGDPGLDATSASATQVHKPHPNTGDPADDDGDDPRGEWREAVDEAHDLLKEHGNPGAALGAQLKQKTKADRTR